MPDGSAWTNCDPIAAAYPGQALIIGGIVDLIGGDNVVSEANSMALRFLILALGTTVIYFCLGWSTNIISQVCSTWLILHHALLTRPLDRP